MLPALQPSRPKLPPLSHPPPPLLRQQTRQGSSSAHAPGLAPATSLPQFHSSPQPLRPPPRSQIEAMPPTPVASSLPAATAAATATTITHPPPSPHPTFVPAPSMVPAQPVLRPRLLQTPITQHYDSAVRHPVFFSSALRRPPFPLPTAASGGVNPVAHGYVVEDGVGGMQRTAAVRGKL